MEVFQTLGAQIENLWRDKNYDESLFPPVAGKALREANLPEKVSGWEVIEWTMNQTYLPDQRDLHASFGDPPITLYNSPRFHIDVYFWLEGTTAVHQHSFCGAFQVLMGSSIHSWYEFDLQEKINTFTEIGNINLKTVDLLRVGDVLEIAAGREYIHGLFHLDQPSATIVVRTHSSPLHLPQFSYHKPYLAVDPFFEEPNTTKKLQCVTAMIRSKYAETDRLIGEMLETADFQTTFRILSTVRGYFQGDQIEQMFNIDASKDKFERLLDVVRNRHGERANIFRQVFAYQDQINEILKMRSFVTDPEHRFFLALLLNVEGKDKIFSLIKERFPDADPIDKILDWSFDLAQMRVLGMNVPNALGIADFGDFDLFILESLLKDKTEEEMREALKNEYQSENTDELAEKLATRSEKIRQAIIFQPLFA
jgi:hypothetical protein